MKHDYADVNGVRLHYAHEGSGQLMLFIHGWPEFWYAWKDQLPEFGRDFHAVAPDTRGINLSSKPEKVEAYHARELVEDMRQLIVLLGGGKPAIVVAHDWGGAAAWNLAAQHPECVEKLVILNSPHPMTYQRELSRNPKQQASSAYMLLLRDAKAERVLAEDDFRRLRNQLIGWQKSGRPPTQEDLDAYMTAWTQPGAITASLNYYRASPLRPPSKDSSGAAGLKLNGEQFTVRVPTLVIWGEQDTALVPELLDGLEQWVPDLRVERIPKATHWVAHEFPEKVNALIREFVTH